jgi:cytochrome P450
MVMEPEALKRILRDRVENYPKSVVTKLILEPAIGDSLFVAEGAEWMWQRRTAAPVFTHRNVSALAPVMTAAAERACARLVPGRAANLFDEMVTATFEVISDVTFSGGRPLTGRGASGDRGLHRPDRQGFGAGHSGRARLGAAAGAADDGGRDAADQAAGRPAIESRRAEGAKLPPDLLDLLMAGADPETGRRMTTDELRDNLLTFIVAGHETTALTLSWALYLCAFDPAVQEAARAEAQGVLGHRAATASDVPALPLIRRIVDEALRLYPPAAFLSRTAQGPDELVRARDPGGRYGDPADLCAAPPPRAVAGARQLSTPGALPMPGRCRGSTTCPSATGRASASAPALRCKRR